MPKASANVFVYLAEAQNGMIKIGRSSNPVVRVRGICAGSPIKVRLIAVLAGGLSYERELHERFASYSGWSEWFYPVGAVKDFVNEVRGAAVDEIADWKASVPYLQGRDEAKRKKSVAMRKAWADPERNQSLIDGRLFRGRERRAA